MLLSESLLIGEAPEMSLLIEEAPETSLLIGEAPEMICLVILSLCLLLRTYACILSVADAQLCD